MAEQSVDAKIADLEKQIEKLKAEKNLLEHPIQEYPKWIASATDPTGQRGTTVNSAEEEKAALAGTSVGGVKSADQKLKSEEIRKNEEEEAAAEEPIKRPKGAITSDAERARAHEADKADEPDTRANRARERR